MNLFLSHISKALSIVGEMEFEERDIVVESIVKSLYVYLDKLKTKNKKKKSYLETYRKKIQEILTEEEYQDWLKTSKSYAPEKLLMIPTYYLLKNLRVRLLENCNDSFLKPLQLVVESGLEVSHKKIFDMIDKAITVSFQDLNNLEIAKRLLPLEFELENEIFGDRKNYAEKLLKNFDKFEVEVTNKNIEICKKILKYWKLLRKKESVSLLSTILEIRVLENVENWRLLIRIALLSVEIEPSFVNSLIDEIASHNRVQN